MADIPHRSSPPLFVFAGGGTGGHLYPALATAEALKGALGSVGFTFFTSRRRIDEQILQHCAADIHPQSLAPLSMLPWRWPRILLSLRAERRRIQQYLNRHAPAAVIGTGGLASVPAVLAARALHIPCAILNPDVVPGKANRYLAPRVDLVFAQWADSARYFRKGVNVIDTGCPIRMRFSEETRELAATTFRLEGRRKTLLVTGASQGARTINEAVVANLDLFGSQRGAQWQILHLTGEADFEMVRKAYAGRSVPATVLPFTDRMPAALTLADLVLSRAGASTLAEILAVGRASILMPYPFHRDNHQIANAECLRRHGAAEIVTDHKELRLNAPALRTALERLMEGKAYREEMARTARRLGKPEAAAQVAGRLVDLAIQRGTLRGDALGDRLPSPVITGHAVV